MCGCGANSLNPTPRSSRPRLAAPLPPPHPTTTWPTHPHPITSVYKAIDTRTKKATFLVKRDEAPREAVLEGNVIPGWTSLAGKKMMLFLRKMDTRVWLKNAKEQQCIDLDVARRKRNLGPGVMAFMVGKKLDKGLRTAGLLKGRLTLGATFSAKAAFGGSSISFSGSVSKPVTGPVETSPWRFDGKLEFPVTYPEIGEAAAGDKTRALAVVNLIQSLVRKNAVQEVAAAGDAFRAPVLIGKGQESVEPARRARNDEQVLKSLIGPAITQVITQVKETLAEKSLLGSVTTTQFKMNQMTVSLKWTVWIPQGGSFKALQFWDNSGYSHFKQVTFSMSTLSESRSISADESAEDIGGKSAKIETEMDCLPMLLPVRR